MSQPTPISPAEVILKKGHVLPVWAGHPWIFAQAIEKTKGAAQSGDEVRVLDAQGHLMGRGFFTKGSAIAVRLFASDDTSFSEELVTQRLEAARTRRATVGLGLDAGTTGYRLFHGEGDGLPGLIVDRFGDVLIFQLGSAGLARHRETLIAALTATFSPSAIYDRTTEKAAKNEGFEAKTGLCFGAAPTELSFIERGFHYALPMSLTQKTGFYFDQRPLRERVEQLTRGKSVLDLYSFIGAIGLAAARGGASEVDCVDSSEPALVVGRENAARNGFPLNFVKSDALAYLEGSEKLYDVVVSDPPKLAQSRAGRDKALSMFRRVAGASAAAVRPGGLLLLSSCSAAIGIREVERALALGVRDIGRRAVTLERIFQGPDHPVPPAFPEGLYLSSILAEIQ